MSDLFLKPPEIDELTGIKKHPAKIDAQCQWLKSNRIKYWVNEARRIIVARAQIEYGKPAPEADMWSPKV